MSKLFEATYRDGYEFYERYYDTVQGRSVSKRIDLPYEWYEESSRGMYESILDANIKLEKKQGRAKDGRDHYGFLDPMYRNIRDNYWLSNSSNGFNNKPRIWYMDIETRVGTASKGFPVPENALEPISMFQIYDTESNCMFLLGVRDWVHKSDYVDKFDFPIKYINCNNEIDLIRTYIKLFKTLDPLIIYAWNGAGFDFPYIHNRMKNLGFDTNELSNYNSVVYKENEFKGKTEFSLKADGHFYIDLMDVYMKFTFHPMPSYALDAVSEFELNENKVSHTEYAAFDDFYTGKYIIPDNPTEEQKKSKIYQAAIAGKTDEVKELAHSDFVFYGVKDTYLIKRIDESKNFTILMCMIAEKMGVQIGDTMGTVKPWSQYIMNKSMLNKRVMPPKQEFSDPYVIGGYVRDPVKGKHRWVLSADVNSMYPLLGMVGFNMSPETYISKQNLPNDLRDVVLSYFNNQDEAERLELPSEVWETTTNLLKEHNMSLGINGAVFTKDTTGMIPELVQEIYDSRKVAKKTQFAYENRKILIEDIMKSKMKAKS